MTWMQFWGSAVYLAMAVVIALIVFVVVRGPMRRLFGMNSRTNECCAFFVRTLFAILLLVALALVAGETMDLPEGSAFMEYVWQAASNLNSVLGLSAVILGGYIVAVVVLLLGLGRYHD